MDRQKIFDYALKIFLFLSPLFFFRTYKVSLARGLFFILGTFALFAISLSLEPRRRFANSYLSIFLLLALTAVFFKDGLASPSQEWFNFWLSCAGFIYVFCGVLLFYIVYCYADNIKSYLKPIVWVCLLNFILTSVQLMNRDFMWNNRPSICGFMENSSQLGQYSALSLPILLYLSPVLAIFPLFTLIVAKSISPILASVVIMASWGGFKGRIWKIKAGIGVVVVLMSLLNFGYIKAKFECRPIMWQKTLKIALQRPFLGWGYRSFQEKVIGIKSSGTLGGAEYGRAHNDYLHTAQELGFPILIIIGLFFVELFKKFKNKDKLTQGLAASIIIVLINASGQTLFRYASIAGTFIVLLALLCIKLEGKNANAWTSEA